MDKLHKPSAGCIYIDKQGLRREVVEVLSVYCELIQKHTYDVVWRRPGLEKEYRCWESNWKKWMKNASYYGEGEYPKEWRRRE